MRILIAEDEGRMAQVLRDLLESRGWETEIAGDGDLALRRAVEGGFDALILDVMLPGLDGFEVARRLRERGCGLPVLMLTARSELSDRVAGLRAGADYYLTKPFSNDELLACLGALMRRPDHVGDGKLRFGDWVLETFSGKLSCGERSVQLSSRELEMLRMLVSAGTGGIKKELLFLKIWGYDAKCESNVLEQYVSFLRKKLRYLGSRTAIVSDRGSGYHLEVETECR